MTDGPRGERRRVLHLITRMIVGGAQENTLASVLRVAPDRYDSVLWTGPQTGDEGSLLEEARDRGAPPVIIPRLVRELAPVTDGLALRDLVGRMKRGRFHLVHTHSSKAGILGRLAARRAGVPCVVHTVHGWGFHEHMSPPKRALYVGLEKRALRWTDRLVSVSNETTRVGLAAGIGRAADYTLIRSGIPLDRFGPDAERRRVMRAELGYADDDVVIISVGRLSAQKNPMDFVELAERLAEAAPRAKFLYVGDGPLRGEVEARLAGGAVAERVRLAGLRRDVPDLMRASDLFVLTSLWEGLPRVAPQALATGLPVFAYDVAGTREIVRNGENGALVAPRDVGALVERLIPLATEPSRLRELSERTVAGFDRSFSEDAMIAALEQLYDGLIAEKSARV